MAWKKAAPIGTVRHWEDGDFIKSFEGNLFDSGWIPLKTSPELESIGRECDKLAIEIESMRIPIDGMLWLDREIREFQKVDDEDGPFNPDDFKQYSGFHGSGKYSFRNEFSKRYMNKFIQQANFVTESLMKENERAGGVNKGDDKKIVLHKSEIKHIRDLAKVQFKFVDSYNFTIEQANQLLSIIKRTHTQLKKGFDLDGKDKEVYDANIALANTIDAKYENITVKRALKRKIINDIGVQFSDNWGIRESFKKYADEKYENFVRKFKDQILKDTGKEQEQLFGVKIEEDPSTFYPKLIDKVNTHENKLKKIDLTKHFGKEFIIVDSEGFDQKIKLQKYDDLIDSDEERWKYKIEKEDGTLRTPSDTQLRQIREQIHGESYPFEELLLLRFEAKYGFNFEGSWPAEMLPAVFNFEKLINKIPKGHCITNPELRTFANESYGSHKSYAHYNPRDRKIFLSKELISKAGKYGDLNDAQEFDNVLAHEIGHSVSQRLGRSGNNEYKKFVVACGWSWSQPALKQGLEHSTGDMKDIPREGSQSHLELLTQYAHKSPEEAFAEFYSFYTNNKSEIDNWLDTGDLNHLQRDQKSISQSEHSNTTTEEAYKHFLFGSEDLTKVRKEFTRTKLDFDDHVSVDLVSPHYVRNDHPDVYKKYDTEETKMNLSYHRNNENKEKSFDFHSKVILIKSDDTHYETLDGSNSVPVFKYNKQMMPALTISKEMYNNLVERGCSKHEIIHFCVDNLRDFYLPKQIGNSKTLKGLMYDKKVIPFQKIEKLKGPISQMRNIYNDEKIQKALTVNEI